MSCRAEAPIFKGDTGPHYCVMGIGHEGEHMARGCGPWPHLRRWPNPQPLPAPSLGQFYYQAAAPNEAPYLAMGLRAAHAFENFNLNLWSAHDLRRYIEDGKGTGYAKPARLTPAA